MCRREPCATVRLIAEIADSETSRRAVDGNLKNLSRTGEFQLDWMERALDMARLIGMTDLSPAKDMYIEKFRPVPTAV